MCSLRFENNLLTIKGVRFTSLSKKTPLSQLSFAFVSPALPLLLMTRTTRRLKNIKVQPLIFVYSFKRKSRQDIGMRTSFWLLIRKKNYMCTYFLLVMDLWFEIVHSVINFVHCKLTAGVKAQWSFLDKRTSFCASFVIFFDGCKISLNLDYQWIGDPWRGLVE